LQKAATSRTNTQLPTFIPLPVFRFTEDPHSEDLPAEPPSRPTSRRNTLASLLLQRKSPQNSKSFENQQEKNENNSNKSSGESKLHFITSDKVLTFPHQVSSSFRGRP